MITPRLYYDGGGGGGVRSVENAGNPYGLSSGLVQPQ